MKTFKDKNGNEWNIEINVGTIKRVRSLVGVDLLSAVDGKIFEQLSNDPVLLCDVIYAICQPEAKTKRINDEEFGRAMAGDVIHHATNALLEELVDFFPQGRREVLQQALGKMREFEKRLLNAANERLNDPTLFDQLDEYIDRSPLTISGEYSGNGQESLV